MSFVSNQNVFGFELAVNDTMFVQKLHSKDDLGDHIANSMFVEDDVLLPGVKVKIPWEGTP
jgi:hypothetical protein